MPLDPRLRTAWEHFLALIPVFLVITHAGLWVLSALTIGQLDGRFPVHFDIAGRPDDWADASTWWALPAVGLGLLLVMLGVLALTRWLMLKHPGIINVPRKHEFLALSPEARLRVMPRVVQLVLGLVLIAHFILLAVVRDTHRVATHQLEGLSMWKLIVLLALVVVWIVVGTIRISGQIKKEAAAGLVSPPAPR